MTPQIRRAPIHKVVCPRIMARTTCGAAKASGTREVIRRAAVQKAVTERKVQSQKAGQKGSNPNGTINGSADGG